MSNPTAGLDEISDSHQQRFQRVLGFASSFVRARRKEFNVLWTHRGKYGPQADEFVKRIDALQALITKGELFMGYAKGQSPRQAMATLANVDLNALTTATKGLESLALELRKHPGLQALVTGALNNTPAARPAGAPGTGTLQALRDLKAAASGAASGETGELSLADETRKLVGMVKSWMKTGPLVTTTAPAPEPAAPLPVNPFYEQQKQAFDSALTLVSSIVKKVTPRLEVIRLSLDATGLPAKRKPWETVETELPVNARQAGLQPAQLGWALMLAELFYSEMRAVVAAHMALTQWTQAKALIDEARAMVASLEEAPDFKKPLVLARFNVGKFKATAFPLSHLHLSFKGMSPLQELFPAP